MLPSVLTPASCVCTGNHAEQADKYRQLLLGNGLKQPSRKSGKDWGVAPDGSDDKVDPAVSHKMILSSLSCIDLSLIILACTLQFVGSSSWPCDEAASDPAALPQMQLIP